MGTSYSYAAVTGLTMIGLHCLVVFWYIDHFLEARTYTAVKVATAVTINLLGIIVQRIYYIHQSKVYFIYLLLVFLEVLWIFKATPIQALYLSLMNNFYQLAFIGATTSLVSFMVGIPLDEVVVDRMLFSITSSVSRLLCMLFFIGILRFLLPNRGAVTFNYKSRELMSVNVSVFILTLLQLLVRSVYFIDLHPLVYLIVYAMILFSNLFSSLSFYKRSVTPVHTFDVIEALETQLQSQKAHYTAFQKELEHYQKLRHDYTGLIQALHQAVSTEEYPRKLHLISEFEEVVAAHDLSIHRYSNNILLDAMLQETHRTCERHGIRFEAQLLMKQTTCGIKDIDAIRIYNNLLTNAIEANLKVPERACRFIRIRSKNSAGWSVVVVENAFDGIIEAKNRKLLSRKKAKGHGLGLEIVEEIIQAYGGFLQIESKETFVVKLYKPYSKA